MSSQATGAGSASNDYFFDTDNLNKVNASYQAFYGFDGTAYDTYAHNNTDVTLLMPGDAFFVYSGGFCHIPI